VQSSLNSVQPIDVVILNQSLSVKESQKVREGRDKREPRRTFLFLFGRQISWKILLQPAAISNIFSEKTTGGSFNRFPCYRWDEIEEIEVLYRPG